MQGHRQADSMDGNRYTETKTRVGSGVIALFWCPLFVDHLSTHNLRYCYSSTLPCLTLLSSPSLWCCVLPSSGLRPDEECCTSLCAESISKVQREAFLFLIFCAFSAAATSCTLIEEATTTTTTKTVRSCSPDLPVAGVCSKPPRSPTGPNTIFFRQCQCEASVQDKANHWVSPSTSHPSHLSIGLCNCHLHPCELAVFANHLHSPEHALYLLACSPGSLHTSTGPPSNQPPPLHCNARLAAHSDPPGYCVCISISAIDTLQIFHHILRRLHSSRP